MKIKFYYLAFIDKKCKNYDQYVIKARSIDDHPVNIVNAMKIKYDHATPHPIGDCWIFHDCDESTLPKVLPNFLTILDD